MGVVTGVGLALKYLEIGPAENFAFLHYLMFENISYDHYLRKSPKGNKAELRKY